MELHAGHHMVVQLLGMNVNMDTIYLTWVAAALVIIVTVLALSLIHISEPTRRS